MNEKLDRIQSLTRRLNMQVPVTITPQSVLKHMEIEETTDLEFADDDYMLERIQTWDEMF